MKTMVIAAIVLLVVSVGLGIWTGISGAPYNVALSTVHKLSSVGFAVLSILFYVNETRASGAAGVDVLLAVLFVVALAALLATGAVMSGSKQQPALLLRLTHIASTIVIAAASGWKFVSYLIK